MSVLIGFQHAGKTSVGRVWASLSQRIFIDTDHLIESEYLQETKTACSARQIYQQAGEAYFRDLERQVIAEIPLQPAIVATGGGSVLDPQNVLHLGAHGPLIYLFVSFERLYQRQQEQGWSSFLHVDTFHETVEARDVLYRSVADVVIDATHQTIDTLALQLRSQYGE